ncbi:DNA-binding FadR family transcriptional regulator [Streptosporangium becharense]|uniref:DNA-binding FadR family transcriptional regulator n=1 Tax=Streptosporangium becharense TaxID=1816182 RepID=A0A7W9IM59_9ACTN|nr:FCD domain-containing protein [Streptosporangium becharense]MBB2910489.1 DNA-binding FadR family transcriptional regulator [Streptosporangium becharense]MBB5823232.1 DNA-binding FadR family transcriptional regulator [Streptosporangium becharense]
MQDTDTVSQVTFDRSDARSSIAETLVERMEETIRGSSLGPGHRLGTKEDLRRQFGVAPATLAEAIRVLRLRGVLDVRPGPGGGIFVAEQSPLVRLGHDMLQLGADGTSITHCLAVLDVLDQEVALDAAAHRTEQDVAELTELLERLRRTWPDPAESQRCNWDLHRRLALISPNVLLRTMYTRLVDYISGELGQAITAEDFRKGSADRLQVHVDLVDAVIRGDQRGAEAMALRHRGLTRPDR